MKIIATGKLTSPFFFCLLLFLSQYFTSPILAEILPPVPDPPLEVDEHQSLGGTTTELKPLQFAELPDRTAADTYELLVAEDSPTEGMLSTLLRTILLDLLKDEFVDEKQWGKTTHVFDGFRVQGSRISKREKQVNHGFWNRHKIKLVRPERSFIVEVEQSPGDTNTILYTLKIELRVANETTFAWWNLGVKGINGTIESEARCQLRLMLETTPEISLSLNSIIPRLKLKPRVIDVQMKLRDLDVSRIGIIQGPAASAIGDVSRKAIEQVLQKQEKRVKDKLQKEIAKAGIE